MNHPYGALWAWLLRTAAVLAIVTGVLRWLLPQEQAAIDALLSGVLR